MDDKNFGFQFLKILYTILLWHVALIGRRDAKLACNCQQFSEENFVWFPVNINFFETFSNCICFREYASNIFNVSFQVYAYYRTLPMPITSYKFGSTDPITGQETSDDNAQFVSSVCWRSRSNMVVAANSSGSIKLLQMVWSGELNSGNDIKRKKKWKPVFWSSTVNLNPRFPATCFNTLEFLFPSPDELWHRCWDLGIFAALFITSGIPNAKPRMQRKIWQFYRYPWKWQARYSISAVPCASNHANLVLIFFHLQL